MVFPQQTNRFLNKKEVSNTNVTLPPRLNLGHITHAQATHLPTVNALDHRDPAELTTGERRHGENILLKLKLEKNTMCKESRQVKEEIISIFLENWSAVSINDADYGCTKLMQYSIEIQPGTTPIQSKDARLMTG